jgi:acyl-coenzyme A thioesterase PaaI-like protein
VKPPIGRSSMAKGISLQDRYAPNSVCFGCGPRNAKGLRVKSFPKGEELVADWTPQPHHAAFAGFASGGILSVLLDCHGNWTAAYTLMKTRSLQRPPGTVTAEYTVRFLRPTPMDETWHLRAWPTKVSGNWVTVEGEVSAGGRPTANMAGSFAAVKREHPAFHRWQ